MSFASLQFAPKGLWLKHSPEVWNDEQRWVWALGRQRLVNLKFRKCVDMGNTPLERSPAGGAQREAQASRSGREVSSRACVQSEQQGTPPAHSDVTT